MREAENPQRVADAYSMAKSNSRITVLVIALLRPEIRLAFFLLPGQLCAPLLQFLPAGLALSVLQGLGEPAQAVQHKAGELAALAADLLAHISAPAGGQPGNQDSTMPWARSARIPRTG